VLDIVLKNGLLSENFRPARCAKLVTGLVIVGCCNIRGRIKVKPQVFSIKTSHCVTLSSISPVSTFDTVNRLAHRQKLRLKEINGINGPNSV